MSSRKKAEAIELPFCAKESGKKKTRILVKFVKDTQQQINPTPEVVPGNCVAACSAGSRVSAFDQASAILDSNSEEAWGERKMRPSQCGREFQYGGEFTIASFKENACTAG